MGVSGWRADAKRKKENEGVKKKNLQCGFGELQYLYTMHQKDLSLSANDLNKLAILNQPITFSR